MRRTMALFALLLAGLLAACGGAATPSENTGNTATTDPMATPSPTGSTDTSGGTTDIGYNSPDLEALLPTSVDGVAFTVSSFDYSKLPLDQAAMSFGDASLEGWLGQTGKTWADVRWASASTDLAGEKTATISVMRVIGADSAAILDWWGGSSLNSMGDESTSVTIGGNTVSKLAFPGMTTVFYQWQKGDTLYWMVAAPEAFGDAVVSATK